MDLNITGYIIVFLARVIDVSLATIRILMLMKGRKLWAAISGFGEVLVFTTALKYVFDSLNDWVGLTFYALGFSIGNIAGIWVEEKLALGILIVRVITRRNAPDFADYLRQNGIGATLFPCQGREQCYYLITIVCERKKLGMLEQLIFDWDGKAIVTISDTRTIRSGHL